jgi:hypothetical protein
LLVIGVLLSVLALRIHHLPTGDSAVLLTAGLAAIILGLIGKVEGISMTILGLISLPDVPSLMGRTEVAPPRILEGQTRAEIGTFIETLPESDRRHLDGPAAVANQWVDAVWRYGQLRLVWPLTDPQLRLALAQDWVWSNRSRREISKWDRELLASVLSSENPTTTQLWDSFSLAVLNLIRKQWRGFDPDTWGNSSKGRRVGGFELVLFVDTHGEAVLVDRATPVRAISVFLRSVVHEMGETAWRVASLGPSVPVPGWPPTSVTIGTESSEGTPTA